MTALVVAVVGALGALLTALLTHRVVARSGNRAERKASNAQLNQSIRRYHDALSSCLAVRSEAVEAGRRQLLEEARAANRETYAAAQMVISDAVLVSAAELIGRLNRVYSLLTPAGGEPPSGERRSEAETELAGCSADLYALRQQMRRDLGITELPPQRPAAPRPEPGPTRYSGGGGGSSAGQ
ncbi:hypothetical protein [Streptomyces sp. RKAG337]|uniref:hypothetical protein n=1 Tax=Streptomyces sp. RKAG337 TaxID=2893404 RepID=UPI0020348039|nr:hypothetical protein [Streptomyces sp. RKAG337]MCM2425960.1 hypothetical protein [Streptomyces sp. RKAG337]